MHANKPFKHEGGPTRGSRKTRFIKELGFKQSRKHINHKTNLIMNTINQIMRQPMEKVDRLKQKHAKGLYYGALFLAYHTK